MRRGSGDDTIIFTRDAKPRSGDLPKITEDITIEGNNHSWNADRGDPVLRVKGADVTIRNLRVKYDGRRKSEAFEITDGKLTLYNVTVENCESGVEQKKRSHEH